MYAPQEILLFKIEFLRNKMAEVACNKGFSSEESIHISQELDELLNMYNGLDLNEHLDSDLEILYDYKMKLTT